MKKVVALLLVLITLFSLVTVSAFAIGREKAYAEYLEVAGATLEKLGGQGSGPDLDIELDADADVEDIDPDFSVDPIGSAGFLSRLLGKIGALLIKLPALIDFFCGLDQRF